MNLETQPATSIYPPASGPATVMTPPGRGVNFIREVVVSYRGPRRTKTGIRCAGDAAAFIRRVLPDNAREHFVTLYLDAAHNIAGYSLTSTGTINSCQVHAREVFQNAILVGSVSILVGHNHPSGILTPSREDREVTTRIKAAGELLGIKCLDHVIVAEEGHFSFADEG